MEYEFVVPSGITDPETIKFYEEIISIIETKEEGKRRVYLPEQSK